jgi:glycosyltransferase involved in cell wall biosynthesis/FtsZ-binding cell division protein ZapB
MSKYVIPIIGSGRSGTSLVTSILHALGMTLSHELIPESEQNPKGMFEDKTIVDAHKDILTVLGANQIFPIPEDFLKNREVTIIQKNLAEYVSKNIEESNTVWGFKDPRTAYFLPMWTRIFNPNRVVPKYVLCVRNPSSVVSSLSAQYNESPKIGEIFWLSKNVDALRYTGGNVFIIHYEKLFGDQAEKVVKELLEFTGLDQFFKGSIQDILQTTVVSRYNRSQWHPYVVKNRWISKLYDALSECSGSDFDHNLLMPVVYECKKAVDEFSGWSDTATKLLKNKTNRIRKLEEKNDREVRLVKGKMADEMRELKGENAKILKENQGLKSNNDKIELELRKLDEENGKMADEMRELKGENAKILKENQGLKSNNDKIELELRKLDEENGKMADEMRELKGENAKILKENQGLKSNNDKIELELRKLDEENGKMADEMRELKGENAKMMAEIEDKKADTAAIVDENQSLHSENLLLKADKEQILDGIQYLKEENGKILKENDDLKEENGKILKENDDLKEENGKILKENDDLKEENGKILKENDDLKEENGKILKENDDLKEENGKILKENDDLKEENGKILKENDDLKEENGKILKENDDLKEENGKILKENDDLKEENGKILKENDDLKGENARIVLENDDLKGENAKIVEKSRALLSDITYLTKEKENLIAELNKRWTNEDIQKYQNAIACGLNELRDYHLLQNDYVNSIVLKLYKHSISLYRSRLIVEYKKIISSTSWKLGSLLSKAKLRFQSRKKIPSIEHHVFRCIEEMSGILESSNDIQDLDRRLLSITQQLHIRYESLFSSKRWKTGTRLVNILKGNFGAEPQGFSRGILKGLQSIPRVEVSSFLKNDSVVRRQIDDLKNWRLELCEKNSVDKITKEIAFELGKKKEYPEYVINRTSDEPLVSIVIPVFNKDEYLNNCVSSVFSNGYENLEIVCVDDCSTDESAKILQDLASKDTRIKYIQKSSNGGASAARNEAIANASGKYLFFVDADDIIVDGQILQMVQKAEEYQSDIVRGKITGVRNDGSRHVLAAEHMLHNENKKSVSWMDEESLWFYWYFTANLYKRDFLKEQCLKFPSGLRNEDPFFLCRCFMASTNICLHNEIVYNYRISNEQMSKTPSYSFLEGYSLGNYYISSLFQNQDLQYQFFLTHLPSVDAHSRNIVNCLDKDDSFALLKYLQKLFQRYNIELYRETESQPWSRKRKFNKNYSDYLLRLKNREISDIYDELLNS